MMRYAEDMLMGLTKESFLMASSGILYQEGEKGNHRFYSG